MTEVVLEYDETALMILKWGSVSVYERSFIFRLMKFGCLTIRLFVPHHRMVLGSITRIVVLCPAQTDDGLLWISRGSNELLKLPLPIWPSAPQPQTKAVPREDLATVCLNPQDTYSHFRCLLPLTNVGYCLGYDIFYHFFFVPPHLQLPTLPPGSHPVHTNTQLLTVS